MGNYSYGGLNLNNLEDVQRLHNSLKPDGDNQVARQQCRAWLDTADLMQKHMAELKTARDRLKEVWPTEQNAASSVFVGYIDNMLASMETTEQRARDNYTALNGVLGTLSGTEYVIGNIRTEFEQKDKAAKEREKNEIPVVHDVAEFFGQSDESKDNAWKSDLGKRALSALKEMDKAVSDYTGPMMPTPEFQLVIGITSNETGSYPGGPGAVASSGAGAAIGHGFNLAFVSPPTIPPPSVTPVALAGDGPILTGLNATLPPPPTVTPPVTTPIQNVPMRVIAPPVIPLGEPPSISRIGPTPGSGKLPLGGPRTLGEPVVRGAGRSMPPPSGRPASQAGRVIGGRPAIGAEPSARPTKGVAGRQMMPKGGVIGGGGRGAGAAGGPGARESAIGGRGGAAAGGRGGAATGGARRGKRRDDENRPAFDPNDPWYVEEGVPGVLEPDQERAGHEPGPGVIGLDR